jgi:hypothetical protein
MGAERRHDDLKGLKECPVVPFSMWSIPRAADDGGRER